MDELSVGFNDGVRFVLELAALVGIGLLGWSLTPAWHRWVWAIGLPVLAAVAWATFRVEGDPGSAPVEIAGWLRLSLEAAVLGTGATGLWLANRAVGIAFVAVTIVHYATSLDRVRWLLER